MFAFEKITRKWRKLRKDELNDLYSSPYIIRVISRKMRWTRHVARMKKRRDVYRFSEGKSGGKRPLGRKKRIWENNITMDLQEVCHEDMYWLDVAQDRDR